MVEGHKRRWVRVASLFGIVSPILALSGISLSIAYSPWFRWNVNALSDLGISSVVRIFNSSLLVSGFLSVGFAFSLLSSARKALGKAGAFLLSVGSISLLGIGVFPASTGRVHAYFTVAFFAAEPLSMLLIGASSLFAVYKHEQYLGLLSMLVALLAFLVWALWFMGRQPLVGMAIPEFQSSLALSCWSIIFGATSFMAQSNPCKLVG